MKITRSFAVALLVLGLFFPLDNALAQTNLSEYIAGSGFIEHGLSTGEYIWFSSGPGAGGIRQYKNTNYEQFFLKSDGYYRREDTSWAPLSGFQDAHCANGNKAIYALDPNSGGSFPPGTSITSEGAFWAPRLATVGENWPTGAHTIVPIDSGVSTGEYNYSLPPLVSCALSDLGGYPASVPLGNQYIEYTAHYGPGEYTFCTGATNPAELVVLTGVSGPGSGDTFFFMKGWGLVGFETVGWQAGPISGPGITVGAVHPPECTITNAPPLPEKVPRTIIGHITSTKTVKNPDTNADQTQLPVEGATICVYQGAQTGSDGIGETIINFETKGTTNANGYFAVDSWLRYKNPVGMDSGASYYGHNYIGVLCGNDIHEVFQVDMNSLQRTPLSNKYYAGMYYADGRNVIEEKIPIKPDSVPRYPSDYLFQLNREIITPIEMSLKCDPEPPTPSFTGGETAVAWKQPAVTIEGGVTVSECPAELLYTDRSGETEGSCEPGKLLAYPRDTMEHRGTFELTQGPDGSENGNLLQTFWSHVVDVAGLKKDPPNEYEGNTDTRGLYKNPENVSALVNVLVGGIGSALSNGVYWPRTWGESDAVDVVPCEYLKSGNKMVNSVPEVGTEHLNAQNVAGFTNLLRPPVDPNNRQSLQNIYMTMDKTGSICTLEDGTVVTLRQIQPPVYWIDRSQPEFNCVPGVAGCTYILGVEYFPYSAVAKAVVGGAGGEEMWNQNVVENSTYGRESDSAHRKDFFYYDDITTYEETRHISNVNEPATPSEGRNFSAAALVGLTVPRFLYEVPPEEGVGEPGLMSLAPVTGLESGVLITKPSPHQSIKGFDHCIISLLDGHRTMPITRMPMGKYPEIVQTGMTAAQFNIESCALRAASGGVPAATVCTEEAKTIDFYENPDINSIIAGLFNTLFNIFSRFTDPAVSCTQEGDPISCVEGSSEDCSCSSDCGFQVVDCVSACGGDSACIQNCYDTWCGPRICTRPSLEYSCNGNVDRAEMDLLAETQIQKLSGDAGVVDTANRALAMILPPGVLKEFGTRTNLCTVDQFVNLTDEYSADPSIGIERDCSPYTPAVEAARQAVSSPKPYTPPLSD